MILFFKLFKTAFTYIHLGTLSVPAGVIAPYLIYMNMVLNIPEAVLFYRLSAKVANNLVYYAFLPEHLCIFYHIHHLTSRLYTIIRQK